MSSRRSPLSRRRLVPLVLLLLLYAAACIHVFRRPVGVELVGRPSEAAPQRVSSPVRAHLADLSIVFFRDGATVAADTLTGAGEWYGPTMEFRGRRSSIPLDSVVGFEALHGGQIRALESLLASVALTGVTALGTVALAVAIFGSCPTIYSPQGDGFALEAEGFSYSISPMLEARDVDVLRRPFTRDGALELEVRNEALETHYINQIELLAVDLRPGERALPDEKGRPIAFLSEPSVLSVSDRARRDVTDVLARSDGEAFASHPSVVRDAVPGDPFERLELVLPAGNGEEQAGLVLRLRNSLLTTLLFYDVMLAPAGLGAADWLTQDVESIGSALEIGSWVMEYLGLRVEVEEAGGVFRQVARVSDVGPIAWEEVVVPVSLRPDGPTRVRISFLADAWRIDRIGLAIGVREPSVVPIPVSEVLWADGRAEPKAREALLRPDDRYLETRPGSRFTLRFELPSLTGATGFLIASHGYYTEWIRRDWVRQAREPRTFEPSRAVVSELLTRWISEKASLEERFFSSAIPVR